MSESKRALDLVISARDDTAAGFKSAREHAKGFLESVKDINAESRASGEGGLEKLIRGAGALGLTTFAVETGGNIAQAAQEQMRQVATGQQTIGEAIGRTAEAGIKAVPVLGSLYDGFVKMNDAASDFEGYLLKSMGASDQFVQSRVRTGNAVAAEWEQVEAVQKAMVENTHKDIDARAMIRATGDEQALTAEKNRYRDEQRQMDEEFQEKFRKAAESEDTRAVLEETYHQARTQADRRHGEQVARIERENLVVIERMYEDHEAQVLSIERAGAQRRLHAAGLDLQAQLDLTRDAFDKMERDARRQAQDAAVAHPAEKQSIDDQLDRTLYRLGEQRREAEDDARQAHDRRVEADNRIHLRTMEDAQIDTQAAMLRASGHFYDADLALAHKAAGDRQEQIDSEYAALLNRRSDLGERLATLQGKLSDKFWATGTAPPADAAAVKEAEAELARLQKQIDDNRKLRDLAGQQSGADDRTAQIKRDNAIQDRDLDVEKAQAEVRIGALRQQAEFGNELAGLEADRLSRVEQLREQQEAVLRIMREQTDLTGTQKVAYKTMADDLGKQAEREKTSPLRRGALDIALPSYHDDRGLTGVAQASQMSGIDAQAAAATRAADATEQLTKFLTTQFAPILSPLNSALPFLRQWLQAQATGTGGAAASAGIFQ